MCVYIIEAKGVVSVTPKLFISCSIQEAGNCLRCLVFNYQDPRLGVLSLDVKMAVSLMHKE